MIKAAIFDMDGLLIDSEPLWVRTYQDVFKTLDVQITSADMQEVRGFRQVESIEHFFHKFHIKDASQAEVKERVLNEMTQLIKDECELLPGVIKTFKICQAKKLKMAIASSSYQSIIDTVIEKFEFNDYFDHVYSAGDLDYGKPHPEVFLNVAKHFQVRPAECVVFEDAPSGVLAAKAAKMHCIAVPEHELKDHKFIQTADIILDSLENFDESTLATL